MTRKSTKASVAAYSFAEEVANAVTHGIAALLSIAALVVMLWYTVTRSGDTNAIVSASIFGSAMIILYTASTLYHAVPVGRLKQILQVFDHGAIYLMIAGSYTPFCLVSLKGPVGWTLCAVVWSIALFGMIFQPLLMKRADWLNCILYLLLGWCVVLVIKPLIATLATTGLWLLVAGGIVYSVGVVFYLCEKIPFNHAIWHLFVLAGTTLQFFSVLFYVLPGEAIPH
ncbi:MAG: hemolysin III family protein [Sutterella sp.]|nr:hemolysin III family protein [Sutterella sp.]